MATEYEGYVYSYSTFKGVRVTSDPAERNTELDITFDCMGMDRDGNHDPGLWFAVGTISGSKSGAPDADTYLCSCATIGGTPIWGSAFDASDAWESYGLMSGELLLKSAVVTYDSCAGVGWVKWSKIGSIDFTIDGTNEAGEKPLEKTGTIYEVKKLGNSVIAYGCNAIRRLVPKEVFWGDYVVHPKGIINDGAVAVKEDQVHWFVNTQGELWQFSSEGISKLGYSQLFSGLSGLILNYDNEEELLYLCNGAVGYVYNPETQSMTVGPNNITGINFFNGYSYVVASSDIKIPAFKIVTDIIDFDSRKEKTITGLEIGSTITLDMMSRVHWRKDFRLPFSQSPWEIVTPRGISYNKCYGIEFKFEFAASHYEEFKAVDWIRVNGVIHDFEYLKTNRLER